MKKSALTIVILVMGFISLEVLIRVFYSLTPYQETATFLKLDSELGFRVKPSMGSSFKNAVFNTDYRGFKKHPGNEFHKEGFKVLILGSTEAFELGVESKSSNAVYLQETLTEKMNQKVIVLNTSQIGYTSSQIVKFVQMPVVMGLRPNIVLLHLGKAETSKKRFFSSSNRSDKDEFEKGKSTVLIGFLNTLKLSRIYQVLFNNKSVLLEPRVSPEETKKNIDWLQDHFNKIGIEMVVLQEGNKAFEKATILDEIMKVLFKE